MKGFDAETVVCGGSKSSVFFKGHFHAFFAVGFFDDNTTLAEYEAEGLAESRIELAVEFFGYNSVYKALYV